MPFSLIKAVKSTHRDPVNKLLHLIGLSFYALALFTFLSYSTGNQNQNPLLSLTLLLTAINLFIVGHTIENNVGAMTVIVFFKYTKSIIYKNRSHERLVTVSTDPKSSGIVN
jgi:hypothetical protein